MNTKNSKQLCPTCKTGQDTYLLDNRNPFCPYLHCYNGKTCTMYRPIKQPEMFIQVGREMLALPTEPQKPRDLHIERNDGIINFGSGTNTIIHTHTRQKVCSVTMKETCRGKPSVRKTLEQTKKEQGSRGQPKPPRKLPPEL